MYKRQDDEVTEEEEILETFGRSRRRGGWGRVVKRRRMRARGQARAKAAAKARRARGQKARRGKKGKGGRGKGRGERKSGGRDPLCQSFTVNETGAFLTSFDVYFASKDPNAKLTVQLRTMELGVPTHNLVQDFCEIVVNPDYINVSNDASVPNNIFIPITSLLTTRRAVCISIFISII